MPVADHEAVDFLHGEHVPGLHQRNSRSNFCLFSGSDLAKGAGWVINLAVAEWAIRRPAFAATGSRRVGALS